MGHYDSSRDGYCGKCGAAPGNMVDGACPFCHPPKSDTRSAVEAVLTRARVAAEQTFVFENIEVKKTGRKAQNQLRSGKVDELVEITPVDTTVGGWKKWVREDLLFKVQN